MKASQIDKLCCPIDKHELDIRVFTKHDNGEIIEALLTCPECSRYFPLIYGIPIMIPDEYRDKTIEGNTLKRWGFELKEAESGKLTLEESSATKTGQNVLEEQNDLTRKRNDRMD